MQPFDIPAHFNDSYTHNVEMLLQRQGPTFLPYVTMSAFQGEQAQVVKQFGDVNFHERTTRHADTQFEELLHKQRWMYPLDYTLAIPVDSQDELRMLDSPLSSYAEAGRTAYGRMIDDIIIPSFFGSAQTGKKGATLTAFDTNNVVAVNFVESGGATNSGLTLAKLRKVRALLKKKFVNLKAEQPCIGVTSDEINNLLRTTEVTNDQYNTVKALVSGEVDSFMGFKFVESEAIPVDGSGYHRCPVWVKSGVVFGQWQGLVTRIGDRPDKDYLTQIHMSFTAGATRTNEDKVFEIKCDTTV